MWRLEERARKHPTTLPMMRTRRLTVADEEAPNAVEEGFPSGDEDETSSGSSDGTEDSDPTIPAVQRLDNGTCAWWKRRSKPFKTGVILGASLILVAVVVGESVGVTKRLSTPVSAMGSTEAPAVTQEPGATPAPNPDPTQAPARNPVSWPTQTPTAQELIDFLSISAPFDNGAVLQTPGIPQNDALLWLAKGNETFPDILAVVLITKPGVVCFSFSNVGSAHSVTNAAIMVTTLRRRYETTGIAPHFHGGSNLPCVKVAISW